MSCCLYLAAISVFLLPTTSLLVFYRYILCVLVIPASYASHRLMQDLAVDGDIIARHPGVLAALSLGPDYRMKSAIILNNLVQCSLAFILRRLLKIPRGLPDLMSDYLSLVMMSPSILAMASSLPSSWISSSALASTLVPATLLGASLGHQVQCSPLSLVEM